MLDDLARASGYQELSAAPLLFVGHSAGGPQAESCAVQMAERCFGLVQYRGGGPFDDKPAPAGIPTLMMLGEYDEFGGTMRDDAGREAWEGARDKLAAFRTADEHHLASIVVEPGAGHFGWSDRNAAYLALFITKAAQARIPAGVPVDAAPTALKPLDPHNGWLSDLTIKTAGEFQPAPYAEYKGEKGQANWHFDEEMAHATVAYHAGGFGKKNQFIKWNDGYSVDAGVRYFFNKIQWVGDGQTFEVHPAYTDKYPAAEGNGGPKWAQAGEPASHSSAPILVKTASGPIVATGPDKFRIEFDALSPATGVGRPTFLAYSVGDNEYGFSEHVGMLPRGFKELADGKNQTITFPAIANLKADGAPVDLKATSDADLVVEYYVAVGPAAIKDGKVAVSELPARAKFPLSVKVVAYQFGRGIAPLVKTAAPVEQTITIEKP